MLRRGAGNATAAVLPTRRLAASALLHAPLLVGTRRHQTPASPAAASAAAAAAAVPAAASPTQADATITSNNNMLGINCGEEQDAAEQRRELLRAVAVATWALPSHQARLANYVHLNPLSHFENLEFSDTRTLLRMIDAALTSPAEKAYLLFNVDPRERVAEAMSEASQLFLDLGGAKLQPTPAMPYRRDRGFVAFWAQHELLGCAPWREGPRRTAKYVLAAERRIFAPSSTLTAAEKQARFDDVVLELLRENLYDLGVTAKERYELALQAMLREGVRGWAGMFIRMQEHPEEAPPDTRARIIDFCCVLTTMSKASISAIIRSAVGAGSSSSTGGTSGFDAVPLSRWISIAPGRYDVVHQHHLHHQHHDGEEAFSPATIAAFRQRLEDKLRFEQRQRREQQVQEEAPYEATVQLVIAQLEKIRVMGEASRAQYEDDVRRHPDEQAAIDEAAAAPAAGADAEAVTTLYKEDVVTHESSLSSPDQTGTRRTLMEREFKLALLATVAKAPPKPVRTAAAGPAAEVDFVVMMCIDDRCGSMRRHIEEAEDDAPATDADGNAARPPRIDTYGAPGFFGMDAYHEPVWGGDKQRGAPVGVIPKPEHTVKERPLNAALHNAQVKRRAMLARARLATEYLSFVPFLSHAVTAALLPASLFRLVAVGFAPVFLHRVRERVYNAFIAGSPSPDALVVCNSSEHATYDIPYSTADAALRVASIMQTIGLATNGGARIPREGIVLVAGHGASSLNNPYVCVYQCGACSSSRGGPAARLFARCANDDKVRAALAAAPYNINIPADCVFLGGEHDTTRDTMLYYTTDIAERLEASAALQQKLAQLKGIVANALAKNAAERCYRFMLYDPARESPAEHVFKRSVDYAEVRPELKHSTSAGCVIGPRALTRQMFLDRRVFLPSYDTDADDARGTLLERCMAPALNVAGGISLDYLMSTTSTDRSKMGAGTKAPLNTAAGGLGLIQGTCSDLRTGLPAQMSEMHAPLRELFLVAAPIARVVAVLERRPELARLVRNGWVRMCVREPDGQFYMCRPRNESRDDDAAPTGSRSTSIGLFEKLDVQRALEKQRLLAELNHKTISEDGCSVTAHAERHGAVMQEEFLSFRKHRELALRVKQHEDTVFGIAFGTVVAATIAPYTAALFSGGSAVAASSASCLTLLPLVPLFTGVASLSIFAVARRFLHGDHVYTRFFVCAVPLVISFNNVALMPPLSIAQLFFFSLFGWSTLGLLSSYSDRPSVRNNSMYVLGAYRICDVLLLVAAAYAAHGASATAAAHATTAAAAGAAAVAVEHAAGATAVAAADPVVAMCIVVAAALKSSQWPSSVIFARSMESPTPASALCYGGLGAHVGIVLLFSTYHLWWPVPAARLFVGGIGLTTAVFSSLVGLARSDRKGALAYATSASIGALFVLLACGVCPDQVLCLALANATYRIVQILLAPNLLTYLTELRAALGGKDPFAFLVPDAKTKSNSLRHRAYVAAYRFAHVFRRFDNDAHVLQVLHSLMARLPSLPSMDRLTGGSKGALGRLLTKEQKQWLVVIVVIAIAGFPLTPLNFVLEHWLEHLAVENPALCAIVSSVHLLVAMVLLRWLLLSMDSAARLRQAKTVLLKKKK